MNIYVCIYTYIYVCVYIVYVYMYAYIYMYICVYMWKQHFENLLGNPLKDTHEPIARIFSKQ